MTGKEKPDSWSRFRLKPEPIAPLGLVLVLIATFSSATAIAQSVPLQVAQNSTSQPFQSQIRLLHVNARSGSDRTGDGSDRTPFKTVTQALRVAESGTVILLAPGTYTTQTGETFPLQLKPGVTIQGDPRIRGQNTVIKGGGAFLSPTFASQNVTILAVNQSGLTGVTVTNPNSRGYGLWIESASPIIIDNTFTASTHDGISVAGNSIPVIRGNYFYQNGANGITVYGTSRPEIRDNVFEKTGFGINVAQNAAPLLIGNRITKNKDGVVVQAQARPVLRNNIIEANTRDGLVAIAQAQPDLGNAAEQGGNIFRNNGRLDLNTQASSQMISAEGNQLSANQIRGRVNLTSQVPAQSSSTSPVASVPQIQSVIVRDNLAALKPGQVPGNNSLSSNSFSSNSQTSGVSAASFPVPAVVTRTPTTSTPSRVETSTRSTQTTIVPLKGTSAQTSTSASRESFPVITLPVEQIPAQSAASQSRVGSDRQTSQISVVRSSLPVGVSSKNATPIPIPVPPPESSTIRRNQLPTVNRTSRTNSSVPVQTASSVQVPVSIPVPPPPTNWAGNANSTQTSLNSAGTLNSAGLLPVPGPNIPLGNLGGNTPPPPGFTIATGLRYRVLVEAINPAEREQLKTLVPDAFQTTVRGRTVLQAGAFADRSKADELLQILSSHGLRASMEEL